VSTATGVVEHRRTKGAPAAPAVGPAAGRRTASAIAEPLKRRGDRARHVARHIVIRSETRSSTDEHQTTTARGWTRAAYTVRPRGGQQSPPTRRAAHSRSRQLRVLGGLARSSASRLPRRSTRAATFAPRSAKGRRASVRGVSLTCYIVAQRSEAGLSERHDAVERPLSLRLAKRERCSIHRAHARRVGRPVTRGATRTRGAMAVCNPQP